MSGALVDFVEGWAVATDGPICVGSPASVAWRPIVLATAPLPAGLKAGAILDIKSFAALTNDSGVNVGIGRGIMISATSDPPANPVLPAGSFWARALAVQDLDSTTHHMVFEANPDWKIPSPNPFATDGLFVSLIAYFQTDVAPTALETITVNAADLTVKVFA